MKKLFKNLGAIGITEYALLMFGCFLISISFSAFLCPHNIASGGVPGLSVVLNKLIGINTAYIQLGINIPLFLLGLALHGIDFGLKTAIGSIFIPLFILITQHIPLISNNILLAAILGGIGVGIGLALVHTSRGSIGGFSLLARLLHDYTRIKFSSLIVMLNGIVIMLAGLFFGFSGGLYALISLLVTGLSIEAVHYSMVLINSKKERN
jgi:uncharacterized membrane-anchored protein YitT (DUF2179 family)